MQRRVIAKMADLPVVDAGRYHLTVLLHDREIRIPRDMVRSPKGEWGVVFELSQATYEDDKNLISDEDKKVTLENIQREFTCYLEIE